MRLSLVQFNKSKSNPLGRRISERRVILGQNDGIKIYSITTYWVFQFLSPQPHILLSCGYLQETSARSFSYSFRVHYHSTTNNPVNTRLNFDLTNLWFPLERKLPFLDHALAWHKIHSYNYWQSNFGRQAHRN